MGGEQDVNVLKIFAQADIASIGHDTNFKYYGSELDLALKEMYEQRPLAYNSQIIKQNMFPEVTYTDRATGTTKTIRALYLSQLTDDTDMGQYGFIPGTRADEILLAVHTAGSNAKFNTYDLLQNPLANSPQSISFISKNHHPTFKTFGIILDIAGKNIINATHYDQGCGCAKDANTLTKLATSNNKFEAWRTIIPTILKKELNLDDAAYSQLARIVTERSAFIAPGSTKTYTVTDGSGKTIELSATNVRKAIIEANLKLIQMADEKATIDIPDGIHYHGDITEYVASQALPTGIYYVRFDTLEQAMQDTEFQKFFAELPEGAQVIFGGKDGYLYSGKQHWESTGKQFNRAKTAEEDEVEIGEAEVN